jgi:hypothetical protein
MLILHQPINFSQSRAVIPIYDLEKQFWGSPIVQFLPGHTTRRYTLSLDIEFDSKHEKIMSDLFDAVRAISLEVAKERGDIVEEIPKCPHCCCHKE